MICLSMTAFVNKMIFLRFFFPDADRLFDMKKGFQFLDKEPEQLFPTPEIMQAPKFVDKLVKVITKTGRMKGREEGLGKGKEAKSYEVVKNLIERMNLTDAQAADIAGVSVDFVKKVRRKIKK